MIDQNILYAECPCGSGKKFKKCHGLTKELEEELQRMLAEAAGGEEQ